MDSQHHVPAGFLFDVMQESTELIFAPSRLNVPRRFSLPDYYDALGSGIHVGAIPIDLGWEAVGCSRPINKTCEAALPTQRSAHCFGGPYYQPLMMGTFCHSNPMINCQELSRYPEAHRQKSRGPLVPGIPPSPADLQFFLHRRTRAGQSSPVTLWPTGKC